MDLVSTEPCFISLVFGNIITVLNRKSVQCSGIELVWYLMQYSQHQKLEPGKEVGSTLQSSDNNLPQVDQEGDP